MAEYGRSFAFGGLWFLAGVALLLSYYSFVSTGQVTRKWQLALPGFGSVCVWIAVGLICFPLDNETLTRMGKVFSKGPRHAGEFTEIGLPVIWRVWLPMTVVVLLIPAIVLSTR